MSEVAPALLVVTGLSGSGISTALHALEDLGYFCVDALPPPLMPKLVALARGTDKLSRLALGLDSRNVDDPEATLKMLDALRARGADVDILFLEATDAVLLRRFSATRRRHPMGESLSLPEAITRARVAMQPFRALASRIIDTSHLTVHQCKAAVQAFATGESRRAGARVSLMSFGFTWGVPQEADIVWDVRFLPNPHFVEALRPQTGLDAPVRDFVLTHEATARFLDRFVPLIDDVLPAYDAEGKSYLTVAIGCTGGRHRSVSIIEHLAGHLRSAGRAITVRHRDIDKDTR
ncbi:MAG: RNase adapter RapZ [Myxococcales bacterium]|nr:RNase adapter RapZ [Myxococcales bacterium]